MSEAQDLIHKLRAAGVGGFLKTLHGRYLWIDSNAAGLLNSTPQQVMQLSDRDLFQSSSVERILKTDLLISQLGRPYHFISEEALTSQPEKVLFFNSKVAVQKNFRGERLLLGLAFSYQDLATPLNKVELVESFLQQPHLVQTLLEMGPELSKPVSQARPLGTS